MLAWDAGHRGSILSRDMLSPGALVEDGDDLGHLVMSHHTTLIFPFYKMIFMNRLEFSCFADFFVKIFKTTEEYGFL